MAYYSCFTKVLPATRCSEQAHYKLTLAANRFRW